MTTTKLRKKTQTVIPPSRAQEIAAAVRSSLKLEDDELMMGSDQRLSTPIRQIGVLPIDCLLYGGIPVGRFVIFTGEFSTLKSYLALRACASTQALGGVAAYVDTERSYDPEWAARVGVNTDDLLYVRAKVGEDALGVAEELVQEHQVDFLVWDSIAATMTSEQAAKRASEPDKVATLARFMNRSLQRLNAVNERTAIMLINQVRTKVGVTYGSPLSFPGGKSQDFYASQRVYIRKGERVTREGQVHRLGTRKTTKVATHQVFEAELTKAKIGGQPYRAATILFDMETGEVDELAFAIDAGLDLGLVEVNAKGTLYAFGGVSAPKGKRFKDALTKHPEVAETLMAEVLVASCPNLDLGIPK